MHILYQYVGFMFSCSLIVFFYLGFLENPKKAQRDFLPKHFNLFVTVYKLYIEKTTDCRWLSLKGYLAAKHFLCLILLISQRRAILKFFFQHSSYVLDTSLLIGTASEHE